MTVKIIECPRDAMQGIHDFIPTIIKSDYINLLLKAGFDTIDFGSFVSPKAIPQMADTAEVLGNLELENTNTKLLSIVANVKGAEIASRHEQIKYLGYPFSISETFQLRNTNRDISTAFDDLQRIQEIATANNKEVVAYLSMGFGNPYGDEWSPEIVMEWFERLHELGIGIISLADTVGSAKENDIEELFREAIINFPKVECGAHFHSTPYNWREKIDAAYEAGCRRFDSAVKGFGGCPMATDELTGNIATENLLAYLKEKNEDSGINEQAMSKVLEKANEVFGS